MTYIPIAVYMVKTSTQVFIFGFITTLGSDLIRRVGHVENSDHGQMGYTDLRDMSRSPVHSYETKLKPVNTVKPSHGDYEEQDDMEAIRLKRFRILREGDWLGLSIQRPLQLKYTEPGNRDAIGKRRKLNAGHEARYSRTQDKIASPFAPNRHISIKEIFSNPDQNRPQYMQYGQTPGTKGSARIFIDGRERNVRERSGSAVNRPHPEYVPSSSSSDVMLLDSEGGGSRQRPQYQPGSDIMNGSVYVPKQTEHGRQGSGEKSTSSFGGYPSSWPQIHQTIHPNRNMYAPSLQQQSSPILSTESTKWPNASPVIYHPTPRSSTTSRLLRSHSSIFEGSVAATGGRKETVTASVTQHEEMWRSWLVIESDDGGSPVWPMDDQSDELASGGPGASRDTTQNISPRLSSTAESSQSNESGQQRESKAPASNFIPSVSESSHDENSGTYHKTSSLGTVGSSKPLQLADDDIQLPTETQKRELEKYQDAAWKAFVLTEPGEDSVDLIAELPQRVDQEDPDAAWKKFVLSSDPDDENIDSSTHKEEESKTGVFHKRMQRLSSKTSLQVHPTETEPQLDDHSDIVSARLTYSPSTHSVASRSNVSEASMELSGISMNTANNSAREASGDSGSISQASGGLSERVANKQGNSEDPLARYMPRQLGSDRAVVMAKEAQLPARNESFERGLDDSLKQALNLGRRYAKQEKERYVKQQNDAYLEQEKKYYVKQTNEGYVKRENGRCVKQGKESCVEQEKRRYAKQKRENYVKRKNKETRDIYDIPISDDTEEVNDE